MPGCPTYSGPQHEAVPEASDRTTHIVRQLFLGKLLLRALYEESTLN